MMTNNTFLEIIKDSFITYLSIGSTSRSNAKLKTLHGHIAKDIAEILGDGFTVKSQGYGNDKEGNIIGRYYPKNVDITVFKDGTPVAGYAVKFIMRNYSQNSNNYFENMLGETANIRANSIPYFQIFITFDKVPHYSRNNEFKRCDTISVHHINKYLTLSNDEPDTFFHTPNKTLFVLIKLPEANCTFKTSEDYVDFYLNALNNGNFMCYSDKINFGNSVIYNDYEDFIKRTYHIIMGKLKN